MSDTQIGVFLRECVIYEEDSEEGLDLEAMYGLYISWCVLGNKVPIPESAFRTSVRPTVSSTRSAKACVITPDCG